MCQEHQEGSENRLDALRTRYGARRHPLKVYTPLTRKKNDPNSRSLTISLFPAQGGCCFIVEDEDSFVTVPKTQTYVVD